MGFPKGFTPWNKGHHKTTCKRGHLLAEVGRDKWHQCNACTKWSARVERGIYAGVRNRHWKNQGIINSDGSPFTVSDYNRLFQIQGGRCANKACNRHQSELKHALHADHNHETGTIRGLLCSNCNSGLGMFHESKKLMDGIIVYLRG